MYEICGFMNIKRNANKSTWTKLLSCEKGQRLPSKRTLKNYNVFELFSVVCEDDSTETFIIRVTNVTGAGGICTAREEFSDRFEALTAYNTAAGNIVAVAQIAEAV